ncbi:chromosome segregation protein [Blastomyces gilchristii SLH14081]|uniref:Chromosome segregation protein n=1 Tax=Blastomyces gilchristii (strain SLH14081) TaxID=559298 RepID=A0A179V6E8_BLAGS|nr:chromosome segregation protein [Blastomyces gilchristii SLH14081]OAT14242.1 chromosome segregation protein [Blastomyces gilchristii SLH14081]
MAPTKNDSAGAARVRSCRSFAQMPRPGVGSGVDKENMTADLSVVNEQRNAPQRPTRSDKKMRSKSLGPGGLDALQHANGNRRKSTAQFPLKSILKPTIPVSPIRSIPSFDETRKRTPARSPQRGSNYRQSNSLNEKNEPPINVSEPPSAPVVGADHLVKPFDTFNPSAVIQNAKIAVRAEGEQMAAAREREEAEQRERERQAILDHRAARRKSMANRRVSFAPEATLHTWNVVELAEDSTSSSASNSTRRASALTDPAQHTQKQELDNTEPPTNNPHDDPNYSGHDPHQKSHRSSGVAHRDMYNPDPNEAFSSSPFSGSSAGGSEEAGEHVVDGDMNSDDDDDDDDGATLMSMENITERSISTHSEASSTSDSARLERSLRQAAQLAGTKGIEYDENGDLSMEFTNREIAGAFQPWVKKGANKLDLDLEDLSARLDQENVNPFSHPLSQYQPPNRQSDAGYYDESEADMSMDITKAIGGIIPGKRDETSPHGKPRRRSVASNDGHLDKARRISTSELSNLGDQTMEFTNVVGGIARNHSPLKGISGDSDVGSDEEMTMEFTSALGSIQQAYPQLTAAEEYEHRSNEPAEYRIEELDQASGDEEMEMTSAVGGILPPIEEQTEPLEDDETMGMEMTNALGKILPPQFNFNNRSQGKMLMELESDAGQIFSSPFQENIVPSPPKIAATIEQNTPIVSEYGSPTVASVRRRQDRRSVGLRESTTPRGGSRPSSPVKKTTSPSKKQLTPRGNKASTPAKTPPSSKVAFRNASPKRPFVPELRETSTKKTPPSSRKLFHHDSITGQATPSFVLHPHRRPSSGLGIDREGLGSPRVAEMLDRRRSIGEDSQSFVPQGQISQVVRFDDPRELEEEIDKEREEEREREIAITKAPNNSQNGECPPLNLKELISTLTPKKNKPKPRKSLHVGAAVGLLGKRPAELDQDDEDEEAYTPKRLRGRDASPVKNIKLPAPPSMGETVRRTIRASSYNDPWSSPGKPGSTTPKGVPLSSRLDLSAGEGHTAQYSGAGPEGNLGSYSNQEHEPQVEPIQLQDFLNMTNIHFMELTTTKRRHTLAPSSDNKKATSKRDDEAVKGISFEDCVAAGFCTVPMLELYQHSCRELKSYISEGRRIIRSIETETYADNPPLFQEYVTAPPDIRLLMDNQFRNVKAHARLLSKSMWYEWRMKLLEGLKEGLDRHVEEMQNDDAVLSKKEDLLDRVVPPLVEKHARLETEAQNLQRAVDELENCDKEELRQARERLAALDAEISAKRKSLEQSQAELENKKSIIKAGAGLKDELLAQIGEAERVTEECRGWSIKEVKTLKASVRELERQTGWSILSASLKPSSEYGPALRMRYRNELQVDFYPGAFNLNQSTQALSGGSSSPGNKNLPITLTYSPSVTHEARHASSSPSPEKALVLHALRTCASQLPHSSISPRQFLAGMARAWDKAISLGDEIRALDYCGITRAKAIEAKPSEPTLLEIRCMVLGWSSTTIAPESTGGDAKQISPLKSRNVDGKVRARIDVDFTVKPRPAQSGKDTPDMDIDVDIDVSASIIYGSLSSYEGDVGQAQIGDMLEKIIQQKQAPEAKLGGGVWRDAVKKFERRVFT